jgi:hypothetical protein
MRLGAAKVTHLNQTPNAVIGSAVVGRWEMSFIVERETTQTAR